MRNTGRRHADRRRAPALRGVDPRDGLSPARRVVQHRQEGRAPRAPLLPRGARSGPRSESASARTMPDGVAQVAQAAVAAVPRLRVGGFEPFTSTDYPDALAAVVFCQGCPWRCSYCHNPHLIPARGDDECDFARILDWLASRRGPARRRRVLGRRADGAGRAAGAAIATVRALGFAIGLHTSGAYPRRLARVLPKVDWVGIDVKAPPGDYRGRDRRPGQRIHGARESRSRSPRGRRVRGAHDGPFRPDAARRAGTNRARARRARHRAVDIAGVSCHGLCERSTRCCGSAGCGTGPRVGIAAVGVRAGDRDPELAYGAGCFEQLRELTRRVDVELVVDLAHVIGDG